ncbi:toxin-antitoxin system YwqK family antitoxin [Saccharicrinis carchari]|nr:hypothetical protein [Saccharicrinis carchari]
MLTLHVEGGSSNTQKDREGKGQVNMTDAVGMKQGHWIIEKNGVVVEEGRYVDNRKEGVWKAYFKNNILKYEITFTAGEARGEARFYYEDGTLRESGNWQVDHWEGSYKYYFESGQVAYDWVYNKEGKREGKQTYFYSNGNPMYEGEWDNGKTQGALQVFDQDGVLVQEKIFENGQFAEIKEPMPAHEKTGLKFTGTGNHTIYNLDGRIQEKGFFVKGNLFSGQRYCYNEEGTMISITNYKNGNPVDGQ